MNTEEQIQTSKTNSPERTISNEINNVEQMAEKIKQLELILNERSKRDIADEMAAIKMFPTIDPDEVVIAESSDTDTEAPTLNSGEDKPFLSIIGDHRSKKNGLILFRCHDTDDENDSWCDADKAITNVGKKEFRRYIKLNKLKQKTYAPVTVKPTKPVGKKDLKRMANLSKEKAVVSMTKIIEKRKTNAGEKYKVLMEDLGSTWKTIDEIGPDFRQLITEYDDQQKTKEKPKKNTPKNTPTKNKKTTKKNSPTKNTKTTKKNSPTKNKKTTKKNSPTKNKKTTNKNSPTQNKKTTNKNSPTKNKKTTNKNSPTETKKTTEKNNAKRKQSSKKNSA